MMNADCNGRIKRREGRSRGTWLGFCGLHILCIFLQDLAEGGSVEADIAEQVEDVQCNGTQLPQRGIQMVQLQQET